MNSFDKEEDRNFVPLKKAILKNEKSFWFELCQLVILIWRTETRDSLVVYLRFISVLVMALFNALIFENSGTASWCIPSAHQLYTRDPNSLMHQYSEESVIAYNNTSSIFFCILNFYYSGLISVSLFFPKQFRTLSKQVNNKWHSVLPYFVAKIIIELIFMQIGLTRLL